MRRSLLFILLCFVVVTCFGQTTDTANKLQIKILPIVNKLQYVGDHPYDWNDGAMIPAKGWQQYLNAGVNLKWKQFEIQIAPELVAAQNLGFEGFSADMDPVQWKDYYRFYNHIELPERFSNQPYNKFFGGQSFLKYKFNNTVIQFSTANKWWGPGYRNALVLSNNAGGFPHLSLANQKPIQTKIGAFNYEFIWGQLRNSNDPPPLSYLSFRGNKLYAPKEDRVRAFQGMHLNYTPKWFSNLTLGLEQSFVQYSGELSGLGAYLPIKNIVHRIPNDLPVQPIILTAFYFNYQLPAVQARLYGEFGWNLNQTTTRNFIVQPDKGLASVLGFSKIFPSTKNHYWEFLAEMTNLQLQTRAEQFTTGVPPSWYLGSYVRQGYTHNGQLVGAGIGPGATSQTIELNWRRAKNRIGLSAERRLHNNDFYVYSFTNSGDYRRWYVDFATTLKIDWSLGHWDIGPRLSYIQTNNYNWWLFQPQEIYFVPGKDKQQFIGQLNFTYHL
jgi:hypothetical protein